jgi:hypothetical protein
MKITVLLKIIIVFTTVLMLSCNKQNHLYTAEPLKISQNLLYAVKANENVNPWIDTLEHISMNSLKIHLNNDKSKKVFWINIYNAYTSILLKKDASTYQKRDDFFKAKKILISGKCISLDDIEHDFLSKKNSNSAFGSQFQLITTDPRIHFALNCGAASCPLIRFYEVQKIEEQLNLATRVYLKSEVKYDTLKGTVRVPAIMNWYEDDFNGKDGILIFLKKFKIISKNVRPKIEFSLYDWTIVGNNFV